VAAARGAKKFLDADDTSLTRGEGRCETRVRVAITIFVSGLATTAPDGGGF